MYDMTQFIDSYDMTTVFNDLRIYGRTEFLGWERTKKRWYDSSRRGIWRLMAVQNLAGVLNLYDMTDLVKGWFRIWLWLQESKTKKSGASADAIDGQNVSTDLVPVDTKWVVGDMLWARVSGHPWWPCIVSPDPFQQIYTKVISSEWQSLNHLCNFSFLCSYNYCQRPISSLWSMLLFSHV